MMNIYDDADFFEAYARMGRSQGGLAAAGEWHQLRRWFPNLEGKAMPEDALRELPEMKNEMRRPMMLMVQAKKC